MAKSLGKLKRVNLQEFWGEGFEKLAAWLTQDEVLEMIGEAVDAELGPADDDIPRGMPKGSTIAKNLRDDTRVLVQGQLDDITHSDLGSLITSAAESSAVLVVWIAGKIPQEYIRALQWLNKMSHDGVGFYGAELEMWRIDDSAPAPSFSLVCQPDSSAKRSKPRPSSMEQVVPVESKSEPVAESQPAKIVPQRKGDWSKKPADKPSPDQIQAESTEGVAVRENFVYTKSF